MNVSQPMLFMIMTTECYSMPLSALCFTTILHNSGMIFLLQVRKQRSIHFVFIMATFTSDAVTQEGHTGGDHQGTLETDGLV